MRILRAIICMLIGCIGLITDAATPKLWYNTPADKWMAAMPLGNGRIGAMVYGGITDETIALNEISMWSGQYDPTSNDLCGKSALEQMREAFFNNDPETGNRLGAESLTGRMTSFGTHLPLGNLKINFEHQSGLISNYHRELDMSKATAHVSYTCDGIAYDRQYIVDYPDDIMAINVTASAPESITSSFSLDLLRDATVTVSDSGLTFLGKVSFPMHGPGGVDFFGEIRIMPHGGSVETTHNSVTVVKADSLTVLLDIRTDYNNPDYKTTCTSTVDRAVSVGWQKLLSNHVADFLSLFNRMEIDLGQSYNEVLPTDQRLSLIRQGVVDPEFDALFFQYGRYMLISSSRPNGMPLCANLQGIWNDNGACNMPWTCDYHLDINIEQNYWSANRTNLAECNQPLFSYIKFLAEHGRDTASKMYGCKGWVAHTVCNAWGYTAPGWGVTWGMNVSAGGWLASHLWSHFLYTNDKEFLKNTAYPLLKSTAEFFMDYMTVDPRNGYLVTGPSISPENGYISPLGNQLSLDMMPTIDRDVVEDIYEACIKASTILGIDSKFRKHLENDIKRLPPLAVGSDGQIREWLGDVRRSDPAHRHTSHLLALFPFSQISPASTPGLAAAAKRGLEMQTGGEGWEDTEWSTANMLCFYARLKESETAYGWLQNLFHTFTRENLMTVSPAGVAMAEYDIFSFDATEAAVAGMCEMLIQSHDGYIEFLPALPSYWHTGHINGICAEGGLTVDMSWENGMMRSATLRSNSDRTVKILGHNGLIKLKHDVPSTITF